eukprot:tig00000711_g3383.t1
MQQRQANGSKTGFANDEGLGSDEPPLQLPLGVASATYAICFVQGLFAASHVVVQYFMKDNLDLSPVQNQVVTFVSIWPWAFKVVYGVVSDSVPILGYRRVPYLIGAAILASLSWASLAGVEIFGRCAPCGVALCTLCISIGLAVIDVQCDASVVQKVQELKGDAVFAASIQSRMAMARTCGEVTGLSGGPFLFQLIGAHRFFIVSAACALLHVASALFLQEQPVDPAIKSLSHLGKGRFKAVAATLKEMRLWKPALLVLMMGMAPAAGTAIFFFLINQLLFTPFQISFVAIYKCALVLLAFFLYRRFLRTSSFRLVFLLAAFTAAILRSLQFIVISRVNEGMLPDSLAAAGCPRGIEGTVISLLSATVNIANILSEFFGIALSEVIGIDDKPTSKSVWLLLSISIITSLLPTVLVNFETFQLPALVPATSTPIPSTPIPSNGRVFQEQ